jgi:hypothetical protein
VGDRVREVPEGGVDVADACVLAGSVEARVLERGVDAGARV